ncbi:MAG TPA: peptide-methionine (S)-S-oxide reductase MsrA [Arachidicoccus sp.]
MKVFLGAMLSLTIFASCVEQKTHQQNMDEQFSDSTETAERLDTATFGTGCFWCTEAIFQRLKGVEKVTSGYSGGTEPNPSYEEVCSGTTGYAEACQILFDPSVISFDELLKVFWETHDPTTLNRQGNDVGTQYRSVIFYHNDEQKNKSEKYKEALLKSGAWPNPVVTAIEPYTTFFSAEKYHQNYYNSNPRQMYCQYVIKPKLEKFEKVFKDQLK